MNNNLKQRQREAEQPTDLMTVAQAARLRAESGSPLSENAIRNAVAVNKLNRYTLPLCGETLLVSRAEVAAYQPTGHKPKGYKHEKPSESALSFISICE
jgi:hypothetical protein